MLSMDWRKPLILAWKTLFGLSLFALPVLGVSDAEASRQKLDSVYVGTLSASWMVADHEGCGERLLGVLNDSALTFGPTRDPVDTNPYFISLASSESSSLAVSMQSSISSQQLVETWWNVQAKLERSEDDYSVSGTMGNDTNLEKNTFLGSFAREDSDWCGFDKQTFMWNYKVNTSTFSGTISATEAVFSIDGSVLDEDTNRLISYVIRFYGKWYPTSAKLSLDLPMPTWPNPGISNGTSGEQSESTLPIFVDANPTPMNPGGGPGASNGDPRRSKPWRMGSGGVAGIIASGLFVLGFIIMAVVCVVQRRKLQRDGKVYPEVAYIYTPSPNPSVESSEGYAKILMPYNRYNGSDLEMRQVLVNDYSLPVTNQHQWRAF